MFASQMSLKDGRQLLLQAIERAEQSQDSEIVMYGQSLLPIYEFFERNSCSPAEVAQLISFTEEYDALAKQALAEKNKN